MEKRRILHIIILVVCIILGAGVFSKNVEAAGRPKLNKSSVSLKEKKKYSLKVKNISKKKIKTVIYKSSKKSVAKISAKGKITAKKAGKTTITCKVVLKNKKKYVLKCKVKVTKVKKSASEANKKKQVTVVRNYDPDEDEHEDYDDGNSDDTTIEKTPSTEPTVPSTSEPTLTPTPEPTPKYEYKVEVLNEEETLYNTDEQILIVHVITDNPDPDTFTVKGINDTDDWSEKHIVNLTDFFKDVKWCGSTSQVGTVSDGYIYLGSFETDGKKEIGIYEGVEYSIRYSDTYTYYGYKYTIPTNAKISLNIENCDSAWEKYCNSVIDKICSDDMDNYDKIYNICNFLQTDFTYYSYVGNNDGTTSLLREYAEPGFNSKKTECGKSAKLVQRFCEILGLENYVKVLSSGEYYSENAGWRFASSGHRVNIVIIDGKEYLFDGCPNGYTAKKYTEDEIDYII